MLIPLPSYDNSGEYTPIISANATAIGDILTVLNTLSPVISANETAVVGVQSALATLSPIISANSTALFEVTQTVGALSGKLRYMPANDFNTASPAKAVLSAYALAHTELAAVQNSTAVVNLFDNHEWIYNETGDEWIDNGLSSVQTATDTSLGVVKGSAATGKATINNDGEIVLNLPTSMPSVQNQNTANTTMSNIKFWVGTTAQLPSARAADTWYFITD
jgi:hypothetical protein